MMEERNSSEIAHITKKRLQFLPGFCSSERIVPVQNVSSKAREVTQWAKIDAARLDYAKFYV